MKTLVSYKNDSNLKDQLVAEIIKHRKSDSIAQGSYGRNQDGKWVGCSVACSLRSLAIVQGKRLVTKYDQHKRYETDLGIPEWLARLEDTIFEGLPKAEAKKWPEQFAQAIPVGVNLEPVEWQFCAYLMKENIDRVLKLEIADDLKKQVVDAIRQVLAVHEQAIKTGEWDESPASAAWNAASAAESAAWNAASAAESAAWNAASAAESAESAASAESAESAAWNAASAAASAAWNAASAAESAESAAESAARSAESAAEKNAYKEHAKKLLELLEQSK